MAADKTNNLTAFLTDIAATIRDVEGTTADINPQDFSDRIETLPATARPDVARAETTITVTADDANDKLTIAAANNQGTGYVTGANKTASTTVSLTASGKTVTATATDGTKISKDVSTASRASTTIATTADDTADTLTVTATNNQKTGYVTGSNRTASKTITLSVAQPTIDASGNVTAVATVADNSSTPVSVSKTSETLALGAKTSDDLFVSGAKVSVPAGYYPSDAEKSVATATRANTSISVTADDTADTLKIDASNNQSTGYVTGANKTATTTVTLTASGATVTATETGGKKVSKSVTTASRAGTTLSVTADDSADTLKIDAANNQGTGYVTGSNQTATTTVTLTASGATVTATETGGKKVSKSVSTVGRADTTLTSSKNTTNNTLDFTASNNQGTGYVTGANKTATKSVSLSTNGATVTASDGTNSISTSVATGSYSASHTLTAGAGSVSASSDNVVLGTKTTTKPTSGHYITTQGSGSVSATGTAAIGTSGYISAGTKTSTSSSKSSNTEVAYYPVQEGVHSAGISLSAGAGSVSTTSDNVSLTVTTSKPTSGYYVTSTGSGAVSGTATSSIDTEGYLETGSKTSTSSKSSNAATKYYTIPTGGCTVSGGDLSVSNNYSGTPTVNISLNEQTTSGIDITDTRPTSGHYLAVGAFSSALSGTTKVSRAAITDTHTEGYIPAKSATTVISASSASPSVTVNPGARGKYITIPTAAFEVSGRTVKTTSTGNGYVAADTTVGTIETTSRTAGEGTLTLTPGAGSAAATGTNFGVLGAATTTKPASGSYLTVTGSGTVSGSGSGTVSTGTGYITSGSTSSKAVTGSKSSKTATVYYPITTSDSDDLTASGATVSVPAGYYPSGASKSVSTVARANTTISTSADTTNNKLTISASNNQGSGYVTGSNKTASTDVTLTCYTPFVNTTTGVISSSASAIAKDGTQVSAAAEYGLTTKGATTITPTTSEQTAVNAGVYTTGDIKVAAVPSGAISASGTASATTTVAPGTVSVANKTASVSGKTQITASPTTSTSGISTYYMAVNATAAANSTGTTSSITGTATADVTTPGYVSTDVIGSVTGTATAKTSAKTSSTYYIPIATGGCTVSGGGLTVDSNYSGTPTVDISLDGQTTSGAAITDTKPTSGYYLTIGANSSALSGSTKVTRAAVTDTHTAGYIPAKSTTNVINSTSASPTVTVNAGSKTEYITLPTGGCTVSGGTLSGGSAVTPTVSLSNGSDTNMSNITVGSKDTTNYPYYFKVNGSSSSGSSSVTRAAVKDTHTAGYIPAKSATTVIGQDTKTVTVNAGSGSSYVGLKKASLSASGAAIGSATVTPGDLSLISQVIPVDGKTLVPVEITTSTSGITTPFYAVVRPEVAAGSGTISGSGVINASVSSAGYAPTDLTGVGAVTVGGAATSSSKVGDSHYLSIPAGSVTVMTTPVSVVPTLTCNNGTITANVSQSISVTPYATTNGYVDNSRITTGYLTASGSNSIYDDNLTSENIKAGVSIFGVTGEYQAESSGIQIPYGERLSLRSLDYAGGTVTYRFKYLEDGGWWESSNKNITSSYSLGTFQFEVYETCDVTFEVINYAESNWDYAIFSKLDTYLTNSTTADATAYKNYKGLSQANIQELVYYNVSPGTHFIAVKFIKDASGNSGNDSVRLRLKCPLSGTAINRIATADRDLTPDHIVDGVEIFGIRGEAQTPGRLQVYDVALGSYGDDFEVTMNDRNNNKYHYLWQITEQDDFVEPWKIAKGSRILGVNGTYEGPTYTPTINTRTHYWTDTRMQIDLTAYNTPEIWRIYVPLRETGAGIIKLYNGNTLLYTSPSANYFINISKMGNQLDVITYNTTSGTEGSLPSVEGTVTRIVVELQTTTAPSSSVDPTVFRYVS